MSPDPLRIRLKDFLLQNFFLKEELLFQLHEDGMTYRHSV